MKLIKKETVEHYIDHIKTIYLYYKNGAFKAKTFNLKDNRLISVMFFNKAGLYNREDRLAAYYFDKIYEDSDKILVRYCYYINGNRVVVNSNKAFKQYKQTLILK